MAWIRISVLVLACITWVIWLMWPSNGPCFWIKEGEYWVSSCGLRINNKHVTPLYCPNCRRTIHTSEVMN